MSSLIIKNEHIKSSLINLEVKNKNHPVKQKVKLEKNNEKDEQNAIVVKNLTKKFRKFTAVDDISFVVKKGTIHGFIGPNGAGKTTTIKCLISAMTITKGELLINDLPANSIEAKRIIGYMPENTNFPKGISAFQFLVSMCELNGLSKTDSIAWVSKKLKELDLWNVRHKSPNSASSGMKRKFYSIQALVGNPEVLIMDEPAANLDPSARTDLFNELKKLKNQGKTIFISSHILSELQEIADEITILNHGKVAYSGLLNNQKTPKYEIKSSDNNGLYKILKNSQFAAKQESDHICVELNSDVEINNISKLALENNITIYAFQIQTTNLQKLYEEMVMDAPKEKQ